MEQAKKDKDRIQALLPLTPAVFHILLALTGAEKHGYGIMLDVDAFTQGQMSLGPGTLYRSIQRMLADGLIEEVPGSQGAEDDERRRYYRQTAFGRLLASEEAKRLARLVAVSREKGMLSSPENPA